MTIQYQSKRIGPQLSCGLLLGLCLAWSGCGTPTKQEAIRPVASRTPLSDLPSAYRVLWAAWTERAADWPLRREMALEDPGLTRFLVENLIGELIAAYKAGAFTQPRAERLGQYDWIKQELAVIGAPAAEPLAELLALGNGDGPAIAGDVLEALGEAGVSAVSDQLLRTDNSRARGLAAELLVRLPLSSGNETEVQARLIELLRSDPDWTVRKYSALALARRSRDLSARAEGVGDSDRALGALSRALVDTDSAVSEAAAVGLGLAGDVRAVPALINHLERILRSTDLSHARSAYRSLFNLTGVQDLRGTAAWREWWRLHGKARIDVQRDRG